jgi:hypothetical protein
MTGWRTGGYGAIPERRFALLLASVLRLPICMRRTSLNQCGIQEWAAAGHPETLLSSGFWVAPSEISVATSRVTATQWRINEFSDMMKASWMTQSG